LKILKENIAMVSVCMITYNHELYIREALDGVVMQKTNFKIELILGEDCSSDETRKICENYAAKYPELIQLLPSDCNLGMSQNGIRTLQSCKGKYIALLEGDDYWTDPLKLQKQVDFMELNPEYSMCFTRFRLINQIKNIISDDYNEGFFEDTMPIEFNFETLNKGWQIGTQTLMFRKESLKLMEINNFKYFRDVHLISFLLNNGKGKCLGFFGAAYRIHENGIHNSKTFLEKSKMGAACYLELYKHFKDKPHLILFKFYNDRYYNLLRQGGYYFKAFFAGASLFLIDHNYKIISSKLINLLRDIKNK